MFLFLISKFLICMGRSNPNKLETAVLFKWELSSNINPFLHPPKKYATLLHRAITVCFVTFSYCLNPKITLASLLLLKWEFEIATGRALCVWFNSILQPSSNDNLITIRALLTACKTACHINMWNNHEMHKLLFLYSIYLTGADWALL